MERTETVRQAVIRFIKDSDQYKAPGPGVIGPSVLKGCA